MTSPDDLGDETPALDTAVVQALQGVVDSSAPDIAGEAKRDAVMQGLGLAEPSVGRRFGRYMVVGVLGRGGMGTVLEAHDEQADRRVAIKLLHSGSAERHVQRLLAEAQALASFDHPNVVEVFEVGEAEGQAFVAMQRLEGVTLSTWQGEALRDWRQCLRVYLQAGRGLAAAHEAGLVHQDFKPANCIIDDRDRVRVLDFGLARRVEGATEKSAQALGTPGYMAPELFDGTSADARSDQFSFCVSLYEALYGMRPFSGGGLQALIDATRRGVIDERRDDRGVPTAVYRIIARGLHVDPQRRWPSMAELLRQLERRLAPKIGRWLALGLAAGMVVAAAGLVLGQGDDAEERARAGCAHDAAERLAEVWSDSRAAAVASAISGTGLSYSAETGERVVPRLQEYAQRWRNAYGEACQATRVRREQSERALELRQHCLYGHAIALGAAVDTLTEADELAVRNAVALVATLPPTSECDDVTRLQQRRKAMALPTDGARLQQFEFIRQELARLQAHSEVGHHDRVMLEMPALWDRASSLDSETLAADVRYWRGLFRHRSGDHEGAERDLRAAYASALEHGLEELVFRSAASLTVIVGVHLGRHAEGLQWGRTALPLATRRADPAWRSLGETALGRVRDSAGEYAKAEEHHRQALRAQREAGDRLELEMAKTLDRLGIALERRGAPREALERYRDARALRERILGPLHPEVAQRPHATPRERNALIPEIHD